MDLTVLSYNDHTLFHMLRHFECISDSARQCLIARGYQNGLINENLTMPGSKFDPDFAYDIKSLIAASAGFPRIQTIQYKKCQELVLKNNGFDHQNGIGTLGVFNKNELQQINASEPYQKMNRGHLLWHASVTEMPRTNTITFVIRIQTGANFLITAFPGLPTMPLPNHKMLKEDLMNARNYWNEKVFLDKR